MTKRYESLFFGRLHRVKIAGFCYISIFTFIRRANNSELDERVPMVPHLWSLFRCATWRNCRTCSRLSKSEGMNGGQGLAECDVEIAGVIGDWHSFADWWSQEPHAACPDQPKAAETHGFYSFGNIPVHTHTLNLLDS
jgi:hypothetical protein